jgi:hypothetical protein
MAVRLDVTHPELPTWRISSFQNNPSAAAPAAALVSKGARAARTLSSRESCRQPLGRTARAPSSRCDSTSTLAPWPRRPGAASEVNAAARPILGRGRTTEGPLGMVATKTVRPDRGGALARTVAAVRLHPCQPFVPAVAAVVTREAAGQLVPAPVTRRSPSVDPKAQVTADVCVSLCETRQWKTSRDTRCSVRIAVAEPRRTRARDGWLCTPGSPFRSSRRPTRTESRTRPAWRSRRQAPSPRNLEALLRQSACRASARRRHPRTELAEIAEPVRSLGDTPDRVVPSQEEPA